MEYFVISAKFVLLKYYTLSSQLRRLTSFSVGCSGRRILSPGQIAVMQKWSIGLKTRTVIIDIKYVIDSRMKLDSHSNASIFSLLSCMRVSVFEVINVYPIDQYQNAIPRVMPLHELKKGRFKNVSGSWHRMQLVIWKCCAWPFYHWVVAWSLNGNAAAHRSVLKIHLVLECESDFKCQSL